MPDKETTERAKKAKREGKSPSTQAGEFVREEIEHIREGKHKRSRAMRNRLKRRGRSTASHSALSKHARKAARKRTAAERSAAARKAARTRRRNASKGKKRTVRR